jgi:formylglycine-generating enzyme required for sulfatase activity
MGKSLIAIYVLVGAMGFLAATNALAAAERPSKPAAGSLKSLAPEALRKDPRFKGMKVLFVRHKLPGKPFQLRNIKYRMNLLGFPSNHESHSSLKKTGYQSEIAVLDLGTGETKTIYKPAGGLFVGHLDLHWNGERVLFTQSGPGNWKVWEMKVDGTGLRQVSQTPADVDCYEPIYVPDGRIIFASNAPYQSVPCWHGVAEKFVANLYVMNGDGSGMRRLCFDQDHDSNPAVRNNGQVIFSRWDYTGMNRLFNRPLMVMNPDGTVQRAAYGSNSWFPNALYAPRELPGSSGRFVAILSGYHGSYKSGQLIIMDTNVGVEEEKGIVQRISGQGLPIEVKYTDALTAHEFPQWMTPYPVTGKQFLVSGWLKQNAPANGIFLADTDDNVTCIHEETGYACIEPIPIMKRKLPPKLPDRTDLARKDAVVYLQDVHVGPGLKGVPRGIIKKLRVLAYDFGYIGLAGNDKIGLSGPWDAMRIVGTTPIETDGSAVFKVPANTPIAFQALDAEGKAVQLMRTWFTAMPGEFVSCVGCHEGSGNPPPAKHTLASRKKPRDLDEWYGPPRGFDFAREVQPVLNKYCVTCHSGKKGRPDLRPQEQRPDYKGLKPGYFDFTRMHPDHKKMHGGNVLYTPAYEALIHYVRRVNVGDDVSLLDPGHYHADTSELVQILQQGHHNVKLDDGAWDRIVTWIDLNGPCHGTWRDVFNGPVPTNHDKRRRELNKLYAGLDGDPSVIPESQKYDETPVKPVTAANGKARLPKYELGPKGQWNANFKTLELGAGLSIKLVRVPVQQPFWMGTCEISNEQYKLFDAAHDSGYYIKRHDQRADTKGLPLNGPKQPVVRVSWANAVGFCSWLSRKSETTVTLPTERQWESACRAGSPTAFHYGTAKDDFSTCANMADKNLAGFGYIRKGRQHFQIANDIDFIAAEGLKLADLRFDDGGCVTVDVGKYTSNPLGLQDMHGNAAEWTLTELKGEKVVKGGSYLDRPVRCAADIKYCYPPWQKVYNTGFRVVINK